MASSFRPLKGSCEICNGARRDCRENTHTRLIHCRHDVSTVPGFRFVGTDALGFNMWAVDDGRERNEAEWSAQQQQRAAERERRRKAEAEHKAQLLDADSRDRNIRKIHAQLGLTTRHRQNLRDRGLTDAQIDARKYFSIAPWQEVSGINPRLAGVDLVGRFLLIGQSGFACPIWNTLGLIIGWQTRFDDASGGKYRWPTSLGKKRPHGATAHLQNGELPITCCRPLGEIKDTSIGLAEGFLKPDVAAHKRGQIFIGAAGANFASSPQQFKAYLDSLSAELNNKTVTLYPDAGSIANNAVMRHYERVIEMAKDWDFSVRVAWWGQVDKSHPDIDELADDQEIAYLTPEEFLRMGSREPRTGNRFADLLGWLPRLARRVANRRKSPWGFGQKGEALSDPPTPCFDANKYAPGERLDVWSAANHAGYRHHLDISATGTGKSFDAGRLTPEMFPDARQVIYISKEHRNPTTPTLLLWPDLEARHEGLYRDSFGKLRRVDKEQPYVVPPNCGRNRTIGALRAKNIPGADTAQLICQTCPNFEPCRAGAVYGYLNQRAAALQEPVLRAHPDSLPDPDEYDYQQVVLVWEEAGDILKAHRKIEVGADDVRWTIANLLAKFPSAFDAAKPTLSTLHQYLNGDILQPNKFGWNDEQIRTALGEIGELDLEALRDALTQNPEPILNTTKEHGIDVGDLPRQVRKKFTDTDTSTADRIARELALNWLPDFLEVLLGNKIGSLRICYGTLTITVNNNRQAKIAAAAGFNIYLDATATASDIARRVGLEPDQILVTEQLTQIPDNLEVIQVTGLGRLGLSKRSDFCQRRVDALVAEIQQQQTGISPAFDFKRYTELGDGKYNWWKDNRSLNDLVCANTLILIGTPCRNLGDLEDEFTILYGRRPKPGTVKVRRYIEIKGELPSGGKRYFESEESADPEFASFVRRDILANFHQAIGRLRAFRRPGERLKVYIIADYPLDIPVKLVKASDITPEAATKTERLIMACVSAGRHVLAQGQELTQQAVSQATKLLDPRGKGYSQQHISRYWALLKTLLDDSTREMSKTDQPPPDPDETQWMSNEYLPLLAESSPGELLDGVLLVFEAYGRGVFKAIWDAAPATAQIKILEALMLTLPQDELLALSSCGGGAHLTIGGTR